MRVWDLRTGQCLSVVNAHNDFGTLSLSLSLSLSLFCCVFSTLSLFISAVMTVQLWGDKLVSTGGSTDPAVKVWDMKDLSLPKSAWQEHDGYHI